jgi:Predicted membrane protein (DUF2142)
MSTSATSAAQSPPAPARREGAGRRLSGAVRRIPSAAWACALVAVLNCIAWSLIVPAFQAIDEPDHYAYVEQLATAGRPPANDAAARSVLSSSEQAALVGLGTERVRFHEYVPSISTQAQQDALEADLAARLSRSDGNGVTLAGSPQPPLYYALELVPYAIGAHDSPLLSLQLMRLLSALLGGIAVLCTYLFLREALPGNPWTWAVGALGVAFQPVFGFVSGGVNPDALLFATCSALFLCLARGFRRGLTPRLAVATGAAMAVGYLTKLNVVGLLPGAFAGLVVLGVRAEGARSWRALRLPAVAVGVAAVPSLLLVLANVLVWHRSATGATTGVFSPTTAHASLGGALSYAVRFYVTDFRELWIRGFVGWFGWVDTAFRGWVYDVGAAVLATLAALACVSLVRARTTLRRRLAELLVYAAMAGGLLLVIVANSYNLSLRHAGGAGQGRYLLPLLALYAAMLVLAARAAGRRWTPLIGSAIVVLALAHDLFSQLLVIARYYT